jgi:hypothetical protein
MIEVRPAGPEMFEAVYPLLTEFPGQTIPKELWRRMLFDQPWPVEEPQRGYVLFDGSDLVGFYGTMFSRRRIGGRTIRFCNLSSWIVKESHRASSLELLKPIMALQDHILVNPSPNAIAYSIFARLGFVVLEDSQWLVTPLPGPRHLAKAMGASVVMEPDRIRDRLDPSGREIHDHLRGSVAREALLVRGDRQCHVVATASPWKGRWRLAHVRYASDWDMFWDHAPMLAGAFLLRLGMPGLRVDGRNAPARKPPFAVHRRLPVPTVYRPRASGVSPDMVDGLYSEVLFQPW